MAQFLQTLTSSHEIVKYFKVMLCFGIYDPLMAKKQNIHRSRNLLSPQTYMVTFWPLRGNEMECGEQCAKNFDNVY